MRENEIKTQTDEHIKREIIYGFRYVKIYKRIIDKETKNRKKVTAAKLHVRSFILNKG